MKGRTKGPAHTRTRPCQIGSVEKGGVAPDPKRGDTGKTHLACALAKAACARRVRSCYVRQPDLEDLWRESRDRPGGERKLVRKYGAFGLLVIDEWLLDRPDTEFRSMLLELMELRYSTASTVFCTQFKKKDWHPRLGSGVHADAIMDRIVHNAVWVDMGEANMRQRRG